MLRAGPKNQTIMVSPTGKSFNVGETVYPDWVRTTLLMIDNPAGGKSLVIYAPPMASGASSMSVFAVAEGVPTHVKNIEHVYEFGFPHSKKPIVSTFV